MAAITVLKCSCFQLALNHTTAAERPLNFAFSSVFFSREEYCRLLYADNKEPFLNAGVKDEWGLWGKKKKKKLGPLPSNRAELTVTCGAGQDCSSTRRKALLCPFFCTACSANHTTRGDTSATDGLAGR